MIHWFVRAALWVRNPPSKQRRMIVGVTLAIAAAIFAVEYFGFWPDQMTLENDLKWQRRPLDIKPIDQN